MDDESIAKVRRQIRLAWFIRALCLSGITACGGMVVGWGLQHHDVHMVILGATAAVLACAVMLLNWMLND